MSRWLLSVPYPYPPDAAASWIARVHDAWARRVTATFAITARGTLVGAVGLRVVRKHDHGELGFWLGARYWGRGLMPEAARAVVEWGFATLRLRRIYAQYLGENHASGRVLEKVGMLREGVRRQHYKKGRRWYDAHQYGILREEL